MKEDPASSWLSVPSAVSRMARWPGAALPQAQLQLSPVSCRPMVGTRSHQGRDLLGTASQLCPVGSARKPGTSSARVRAPARYRAVIPPSGLPSDPSFATELWHLTHSPSGSSSPVPLSPHTSLRFLNENRESPRHPAPSAPGLQAASVPGALA